MSLSLLTSVSYSNYSPDGTFTLKNTYRFNLILQKLLVQVQLVHFKKNQPKKKRKTHQKTQSQTLCNSTDWLWP